MKLHHWFIPNRKNKFHPIALRPLGLIVFLAIFFAIPLLYNVATAKKLQVLGYATSISVSDLNSLTNQQRAANGLPALTLNSQLASAAQAKAADMFADNYWAHVAPDGVTPWSFILATGYDYTSAGENLAKDFSTSSGVVDAWMNSSSHRANILNTDYADVGYAVVNGNLLGEDTTLVVAMYGLRTSTTVASTTPTQTSTPTPTTTTTSSSSPTTTSKPTSDNSSATPSTTAKTNESTVSPSSKDNNKTASIVSKNSSTKQSNSGSKNSVTGLSASLPVRVYTSMNWGQKVSVMLICTLILLFVMKHTLIWREQKRGFRHIWLRSHPLSQGMILVIALLITIVSSVGIIL